MKDTDLYYSIERGLHQGATIQEFAWQEKETEEMWLTRTGFRVATRAGGEYSTSYKCYERDSHVYPYFVELIGSDRVDSIFCENRADYIALRAYLAPLIVAEEGFFPCVLDELCNANSLQFSDGRIKLDPKGTFVQFVKQLAQDVMS